MNKKLLFLYCFIITSLIDAGFSGDTLVKTPKGLVAIKHLKKGDQVNCFKRKYFCTKKCFEKIQTQRLIQKIRTKKVDNLLKITMIDGTAVRVDLHALFYVPQNKKWLTAQNLSVGQSFLQHDMKILKIKKIEKIKTLAEVFDL